MTENTAKNRKPVVSAACIGCGACAAISGDVFEMDFNSGLSVVRDGVEYEGKDVDDCILACPVGAISWQEAAANDNVSQTGQKQAA